jgi:hypothetical protein
MLRNPERGLSVLTGSPLSHFSTRSCCRSNPPAHRSPDPLDRRPPEVVPVAGAGTESRWTGP